jgi:MFS family permease
MPKIFDERLRALTETNVGIGALVAVVYSIAAFAQVLMGTLMSRFDMKHLMIGVGLVQIPLLAAAATLDGWAMLVVALLMMMAIFGQIPLNDGIVGKYVADEYRARVLSVRYVVSLGVASVAVPMIAVLHRTEGGFRNVFLVLSVLACAVFVSALFFPSREKIRQPQSAAAPT